MPTVQEVLAQQAGRRHTTFGAGTFAMPDTVHLGNARNVHGDGSDPGGSVWTWAGPDDGRPWVVTDGSVDFSNTHISGLRITGPPGMTGGGVALALANPQNMTTVTDVMVANAPTGVRMYDRTPTGVNYPGFVRLERVWATGCREYGFVIESGTTGILLDTCGSDPAGTAAKAAFLHRMKEHAAGAVALCTQAGNTGTIATVLAHGIASPNRIVQLAGVDVPGFNGMYRINQVTSPTTFTISNMDQTGLAPGMGGTFSAKHGGNRGGVKYLNCKSEHYESAPPVPTWHIESLQRVVLDTCDARWGFVPGGTMIQWDGPSNDETGANVPLSLPLTAVGVAAQGYSHLLRAPRFGVTVLADNPLGGRAVPFRYP